MKKTLIKKRYSSSIKVISIGNITVGGSGKTPFTIYLTDLLSKNGFKCCVITRGYKDENRIYKRNGIRIYSDKRLLDAIKKAEIDGFYNLILVDDGFTHYRLNRDIDILLVDGENPFGNGLLLPFGPLRESVEGISRSDLIIIKNNTYKQITEKVILSGDYSGVSLSLKRRILSGYLEFSEIQSVSKHESFTTNDFAGKKIICFCSIGSPVNFYNFLKNHNISICKMIYFYDHYIYNLDDIKKIRDTFVKNNADAVFTTEKDISKINNEMINILDNLFVVKVKFKLPLNDEEELMDFVNYRLSGKW